MRRFRRGVPALAAAAIVSACATGTPADPSGSPSGAPSGSTAPTELRVTVSDGQQERSFTVTCDPVGGDHPHPESACDFLELAAKWGQDPFAPSPSDVACAQVYSGPETATVTGTWRGRPVDARFSRTNSCETGRWDNAIALLALRSGYGSGIQPSTK